MKQKSKPPVRVAITGAAGQIGYQLAFRIASGQLFGQDQPIILQLLEITPALGALNGVAMELDDCAFDTLHSVVVTDKAEEAFRDTHYALLVGARPRGPGMERKDLLIANAQIFSAQGKALDKVADRRVKVLVVGNPANTNALIARENAKGLDPAQLHRDDAPRSQPRQGAARRQGRRAHVSDVQRAIIWGNHSATQFPDLAHATVNGTAALTRVSQAWYRDEFIPTVQQRGAAIIKARGASSAASAASAAIDHVRDWALGTTGRRLGQHGASRPTAATASARALVYSYPVRCVRGEYQIVQGLAIDDFGRSKMTATEAELREERAGRQRLAAKPAPRVA